MTKEELVNQMKFHRTEYEKLSVEWKKLMNEEDNKAFQEQQQAALVKYRERYKFYAEFDKEGTIKPIDWAEIEKLISTSTAKEGHCLTFDNYGNMAIGVAFGGSSGHSGGGAYHVIVEDEVEATRYLERQARMALIKKNGNK